MARQQPQGGYGGPYSSQLSTINSGQGQSDDEHARACSYVQEQLRHQIGDQPPAWDGPVPGFWDKAPPLAIGDQPTQRTTKNFGLQPQGGYGGPYSSQLSTINSGQGQSDDEHARACSYVQEQLRHQIGDQPPAWDGPVPGFWDKAPLAIGDQPTQRTTKNFGQGKSQASQQGYENQHTQSAAPGPNAGHGQPASYSQGSNQHGCAPSQSGSQANPSKDKSGRK